MQTELRVREPSGEAVSPRVAAIVRSIEQEIEAASAELRSGLERRSDAVRAAAETDARKILRETTELTSAYVAEARGAIEDFSADRIVRISALTDDLLDGLNGLSTRLADASEAQRGLADLVASLGSAAEAIRLETGSRRL